VFAYVDVEPEEVLGNGTTPSWIGLVVGSQVQSLVVEKGSLIFMAISIVSLMVSCFCAPRRPATVKPAMTLFNP
jgi:hypothetical protein